MIGARSVSSAILKVPQLVSTTAVSSSPFFTVCAGFFRLTSFGSGASTCLQPPLALAEVLDPELPPPREIRIAATMPTATTAKTARMIQRRSGCCASTVEEPRGNRAANTIGRCRIHR